MLAGNRGISKKNLEVLIVHQKRLKHILLVPSLTTLKYPCLRVIGWPEDIVYVDHHSWCSAGKNLKKEPIYVTCCPGYMRSIVEENISLLQHLYVRERSSLKYGFLPRPMARKDGHNLRAWIRLYLMHRRSDAVL